MVLHEAEEGVEARVHLLKRRQRGIGGRELAELVGGLAQDGEHEVLLRREVVVEQPLRDPGGAGDLVDRDLVVGALAEQLEPRVQQLLAPLVGLHAGAAAERHAG